MKRRELVFAVFVAYVFVTGQSTTVERSGDLCVETGASSDKQNVDYGVRLFAPVLTRPGQHGGSAGYDGASSGSLTLNPHRIASALASDPVLHALYRPVSPSFYHVIVHPLFTARDAALRWNQTWQTALASRWRALAVVRKELSRNPILLHPTVHGFHAGRYSLTIELEVASNESAIIADLWDIVARTSGINIETVTPQRNSFILRVPIAYRRIDMKSGKCCFCCPSRGTLSVITGLPPSRMEEGRDDETEECCMAIEDDSNNVLFKRIGERLTTLMQDSGGRGGGILPVGTKVHVGTVQMGHFLRQGEMKTPKHWAIHYLLPGGRDERYPIGALLCLICSICSAIVFCVVKLRRVPLILWDVKRR